MLRASFIIGLISCSIFIFSTASEDTYLSGGIGIISYTFPAFLFLISTLLGFLGKVKDSV